MTTISDIKTRYCIDAAIDKKRINKNSVVQFYFSPTADGKGGTGGYTPFVKVSSIPGWEKMTGQQLENAMISKMQKNAKWEKRGDGTLQVLVKEDGVFGWSIYKNKNDFKIFRRTVYYNDK